MFDQLQLAVSVPVFSNLTADQRRALDAIEDAGYDGLHTDELGAIIHRHSEDDRCAFCGSRGMQLGRALRAKGLVQQRRRKAVAGDTVTVWTVAGKLAKPDAERDNGGYNVFPDGF